MKLKNLTKLLIAIIFMQGIAACNYDTGLERTTDADGRNYPIDPEDARRLRQGKLTGDQGLRLFGDDEEKASGGAGSGVAVNSFLWRATLETLSFVPLASTDPFGGVILTDWYENPEAPGERFKINTLILDKKLRVDGIKVTVYKQKLEKGVWRDVSVDSKVARELEDKILSRAREMKIAQKR